jgi:hypothetical protein
MLRAAGLAAVRYGLPLAMVVGGIVALEQGGSWAGFGVVVIGAAFIVLMLNVLFRISIVSNRERSREEDARDYYARHGHWPEERR